MAIRTEIRDSGGAVTATPVNTVPLEPATGVEQTGDETVDGVKTFIGKILFAGAGYIGLQSNVVTGTADASISNTAYVLLTGMTLTPAAGTYLVWFMSSVESSSVTDAMFVSLFAGGVQVAASEIEDDSKTAGESDPISTLGKVTVNGSQAIEVKWKNNGSATATMHERTLMILRVA